LIICTVDCQQDLLILGSVGGSAPGDRDRPLAPRVSQQCVWSSIVACQCRVVTSSSVQVPSLCHFKCARYQLPVTNSRTDADDVIGHLQLDA